MKLRAILKISVALPALLILTGCKKFIEVELPPTQTSTEALFASEQTAVSAVTGIYTNLVFSSLSFSNGGMSIYPSLSADDLYNTAPNEELDVFTNNSIPATNNTGIYQRIWARAYSVLYQVNAVMAGLEKSENLSGDVKRQLTGEARTIRAFIYFYLVNLFGNVPLITGTDYRENGLLSRAPLNEVHEQIKKDLEQAVADLNTTYPTTGRIRINKWAAVALLARVYLYNKDWEKAEAQAGAVIGSGNYSLVSNLNNVFTATSNEAIWQLMRETNNTAEANAFIPSGANTRPTYAITNSLLMAFENNDQRKMNWLKTNIVSGQSYYYPFKYKIRSGTPVTEYLIVLRLAEQYLIRAEARTRQNNLQGAKSDLNEIRKRSGLPDTDANTKDEMQIAIEHERQTELFAEWGHRWFDLKRWEKANAVLNLLKAPNWQPTDMLYPIPLQEIQRNSALVQNEGY
jgi:hypothetical protein